MSTEFWVELQGALFIHNPDWNRVTSSLVEKISYRRAQEESHSAKFITNHVWFCGKGQVGDRWVVKVSEVGDIQDILNIMIVPEWFSVENCFLQWCFQFFKIEAAYNAASTPLGIEPILHAMVYFAAMILLYEELSFKAVITPETFQYTEHKVQSRVKELIPTLFSKCSDYGESFRRHGIEGLIPRLWDKASRYTHLSASGGIPSYEPKHDSAKDLLGYCLIAWSLVLEQEGFKGVEENTASYR